MKLEVPLLRQAKQSADCGPACVSMLLSYYGVKKNPKKVSEEIRSLDPYKDRMTYTPQLGSYLIDQGFKAELVTLNPFFCFYKDRGKEVHLEKFERLYELMKDRPDPHDWIKRSAKFFVDFIGRGGRVTARIPDEKDVKGEIENSRPVFAQLDSRVLYKTRAGKFYHFNIITGIDRGDIYVNDPLPYKGGGRKSYPIKDFLFAVYATASASPDNACLLKISK